MRLFYDHVLISHDSIMIDWKLIFYSLQDMS